MSLVLRTVHAVGKRVIEESLPYGRGPFLPVLIDVVRKLMEPPAALGEVVAELLPTPDQCWLADADGTPRVVAPSEGVIAVGTASTD